MKLTKRAKIALEQSINHWEKDIIQELRKGRVIEVRHGILVWKDNFNYAKCYKNDCKLCWFYHNTDCVRCPYRLFYKIRCTYAFEKDMGHWNSFAINPCLQTAVAMKESLETILKS